MRNTFDQARNHGFLQDRGAGNAREANSKLESMAAENPEEHRDVLHLAAKTMGVLDQRSRKELVQAISSGYHREVDIKTPDGGKWHRVMSFTTTSD